MRMRFVLFLLLLLAILPSVASAETWMFAVNVGKGDAVFVGADGCVALIDTGYSWVRGRIMTAMDYLGIKELDAVFLTHTDKDHIGGLEWLADSDIPVGHWYASEYYLDVKESKHPMNKAALSRGQQTEWLSEGDTVSLGSAVLRILGPVVPADDKDDNNSLVIRLESSDGTILLAGDMESPEEETILDLGVPLKSDILKVANHGDGDTTGKAFTDAVKPKLSVISTSSTEKPGTPAAVVIRRLTQAGSKIAVTQDSGLGIYVSLQDGTPEYEMVPVEDKVYTLSIERVDADTDTVVLRNTGTEDINLHNYYLCSSRGEELFVFPDSCTVAAGASMTVGTNSTKGGTDVVWPDKKVIHASKTDIISLYAPTGTVITQKDNGK